MNEFTTCVVEEYEDTERMQEQMRRYLGFGYKVFTVLSVKEGIYTVVYMR